MRASLAPCRWAHPLAAQPRSEHGQQGQADEGSLASWRMRCAYEPWDESHSCRPEVQGWAEAAVHDELHAQADAHALIHTMTGAASLLWASPSLAMAAAAATSRCRRMVLNSFSAAMRPRRSSARKARACRQPYQQYAASPIADALIPAQSAACDVIGMSVLEAAEAGHAVMLWVYGRCDEQGL